MGCDQVGASGRARGAVEAHEAAELLERLAQHRGRKGARNLAAILGRPEGPAFTRSEAEARFLALVRKAGVRPPEVNAKVRALEVDFLWRAERLIVEVDGAAYHTQAQAFEADRARDATLSAAGFRVMRVTWRQLTETWEQVLFRLAQALVTRT